ncbi:MAG TPA: hypothetical protein VMB21_10945 [Candidatus Limnocylindria bacterium]|jgi:hypothetical protein|nr:hypothetical protein [Candidatus Limnocylindria bacterium]
MNPLRLNTVTVSVALVAVAGLISGCQSGPHPKPKLARERAFSRAGDREDLEIRVQVSPVEHKAHWYKMESVIVQRKADGASRGDAYREEDQLTVPTLQVAVGANAVSYQVPGPESGLGPRVSFKVYEREGKLIAEYEIGYTSKAGDSLTRKGRLILKTAGTE